MKKNFSFALFHVLFFSLMWLSKTVHVVFFEQNHSVVNFGIGYSAMALAGYFSFFIGHAADVIGFRKMIGAGALFYGVGLVLRIFPESMTIAILSGGIAGLGASTCLSAMRLWMLSLANEESRAKLVGLKSSCTALGTAIGCISVAALPFAPRQVLLFSGLAMIGLAIAYVFIPSRGNLVVPHKAKRAPWQGLGQLFGQHKNLAITTSVLGVCTGLYVSFIGPYLPLLLKDKGLSLSAIGFSTGAFAIVRFVADPWIAKTISRFKDQNMWIFLASELVIALVTAAFLLPISKSAFVLLLLMRSLSLGFSALTEELLWLRIFPADSVGLFFGLNQSSFFVGDFIGGLLNGYIYKAFGLGTSIQVVMIVMLINAILFFRLISRSLQVVDSPKADAVLC